MSEIISGQRRIILEITDRCNLSCQYCFPRGMTHKIRAVLRKRLYDYSPRDILKGLRRIGDGYIICISGGEPFTYERMSELLELLHPFYRIDIMTNLSIKGTDRILENIPRERIRRIVSSYHPISLSKSKSEKIFLNNIRYLLSKGIKLRLQYVMHPSQFSDFSRYRKTFADMGVPLIAQHFYGKHAGKYYPESYNQTEIEFLNGAKGKSENKEISMVSYMGSYCRAGVDLLTISVFGDVYRCHNDHKNLGNLFRKVHVNQRSEICTSGRNQCPDHCYQYSDFHNNSV